MEDMGARIKGDANSILPSETLLRLAAIRSIFNLNEGEYVSMTKEVNHFHRVSQAEKSS